MMEAFSLKGQKN